MFALEQANAVPAILKNLLTLNPAGFVKALVFVLIAAEQAGFRLV